MRAATPFVLVAGAFSLSSSLSYPSSSSFSFSPERASFASSPPSPPPPPPPLLGRGRSAARGTCGGPCGSTALDAVSKRQLAIFDGPELSSIVSFLRDEERNGGDGDGGGARLIPDLAAKSPDKARRVGGMSVVVGTVVENEEDATTTTRNKRRRRVVGVEIPKKNGEEDVGSSDGDATGAVFVGDGTYLYADSVADVPPSVSDEDAVSTAAAALCGVHCGAPARAAGGRTGKAVVVGGSDYARFTARGLEAIGASEVYLVSIRPGVWLPSESKVKVMEPAVGKLKLGFADAIGKFDTLVDTLGDVAKFGEIPSFAPDDDEGPFMAGRSSWIVEELQKQHDCTRYISAVTRSQKYVLDEGLLFARKPVLRYQEDIERRIDPQSAIHHIRPPRNYGPDTLAKLLHEGVVYRADRNENGPNADKDAFVRGCCFMDLTELKTWPRGESASKTMFGFPKKAEVDVAAKWRSAKVTSEGLREAARSKKTAVKVVEENTNGAKEPFFVEVAAEGEGERDGKDVKEKDEGTRPSPQKQRPTTRSPTTKSNNPFLTSVRSPKELNDLLIVDKEDAMVLFLTAGYCRTCRAMGPTYARMARIHTEEKEKDGSGAKSVLFARADIGTRDGKALSRALGVESVPSFVLFRNGDRYGETLRMKRLPSKKLELAVEYLREGRRWEKALFEEEEEENKDKGEVKVGKSKEDMAAQSAKEA